MRTLWAGPEGPPLCTREESLQTVSASLLAVAVAVTTLTAGQRKPGDVPADYSAILQVVGQLGAASASMRVHIDGYTTDGDRTTLLNALRLNGYQAFLPAFRKLPAVGYVQVNEQKWNLRWAQQQPRELGLVITAATDQPIDVVGGGNLDAKPRAGYEMAVIRFEVDTIGMGTGTMAAAARIKPTADATSVEVDDYATTPLTITSVRRIF